jgi:hypothetical protein
VGDKDTVSRLEYGLRLAILFIVVITLFGLALPTLLANSDFYRYHEQEFVAFGLLIAVTAVSAFDVRPSRLPSPLRWVLLAAILAAAVLAVTGVFPEDLSTGESEWSLGVTGWMGLLLLLDRNWVASVVFVAGCNAISVAQMIATGQDVLRFAIGALLVLAFQLPVIATAVVLRRFAANAAELARREAVLRTAEDVAIHIQEDRKARYAAMADTTVPLLADLAAGTSDLKDEQVRTRYAVEAARMRRLFAESDDVPDPLLHELQACLDLAERKGITVQLDSWGERPVPPLAVRRALTEPVVQTLAGAASMARVTLIGEPGVVTVSVVADSPGTTMTGDPSVTVTNLSEGDRVWVEATWRS